MGSINTEMGIKVLGESTGIDKHWGWIDVGIDKYCWIGCTTLGIDRNTLGMKSTGDGSKYSEKVLGGDGIDKHCCGNGSKYSGLDKHWGKVLGVLRESTGDKKYSEKVLG